MERKPGMKQEMINEFKKDLSQFKEVTAGFYKGEVTSAEYKGFSGGFGSYAQRGGKNSMLRLRLTGGRINKDQLQFIVNAVKTHKIDTIHFTTCQTIQLHNLNEAAVCQIMEDAFEKEKLHIEVKKQEITKAGSEEDVPEEMYERIIKQKQKGLFSVHYHPVGGCISPEKLEKLYLAIKDMEQVELALSPDESVYILNLNKEEAMTVYDLTKDSAQNELEASVACIGSTICQVGLQDSQGLLKAIVEAVRKENFQKGVLPKLHISGCVSSCGTHQAGSMGFHGFVKRVDDLPQPAFNLFIGGSEEQGKERFGEAAGSMLASDIPEFMVKLGRLIQASDTPCYELWYENHKEELMQLAKQYIDK